MVVSHLGLGLLEPLRLCSGHCQLLLEQLFLCQQRSLLLCPYLRSELCGGHFVSNLACRRFERLDLRVLARDLLLQLLELRLVAPDLLLCRRRGCVSRLLHNLKHSRWVSGSLRGRGDFARHLSKLFAHLHLLQAHVVQLVLLTLVLHSQLCTMLILLTGC